MTLSMSRGVEACCGNISREHGLRAGKEQQPNILKGARETAVQSVQASIFLGLRYDVFLNFRKPKKRRQVPSESHIPLISPNCEGPRCLYIILFSG